MPASNPPSTQALCGFLTEFTAAAQRESPAEIRRTFCWDAEPWKQYSHGKRRDYVIATVTRSRVVVRSKPHQQLRQELIRSVIKKYQSQQIRAAQRQPWLQAASQEGIPVSDKDYECDCPRNELQKRCNKAHLYSKPWKWGAAPVCNHLLRALCCSPRSACTALVRAQTLQGELLTFMLAPKAQSWRYQNQHESTQDIQGWGGVVLCVCFCCFFLKDCISRQEEKE